MGYEDALQILNGAKEAPPVTPLKRTKNPRPGVDVRNAQLVEVREDEESISVNPTPATKTDTTKKELAVLNAKVAVLEKGNKLDGDALGKVLDALENGKAELEQNQAGLKTVTKELEAANNRIGLLEQSLATFEEATAKIIDGLQGKIKELLGWKAEAEEIKADSVCPKCGSELKFDKGINWPLSIFYTSPGVKQCTNPSCDYIAEAMEEAEVEAQAKSEKQDKEE